MSTKISALPLASVLNDGDNVVLAQPGVSRRMTAVEFRDKLAGLQGVWDVTGASQNATPTQLDAMTVAAQVNPEDFAGTPLVSASAARLAGAGPVTLTTGQGWARHLIHTPDGGDNDTGLGVMLANAGATFADILATVGGFPTFVGSCTALVLAGEQGGFAFGFLATATGGIVGSFPVTAVVPGDVVYIGYDADTGEALRQINAGAVTAVPISFGPAGLQPVGFMAFSAPTPILLNPFVFSLGTSAGGRTPFTVTGDAVPPVGFADGKKYLVENTGTFAGKPLADGDVAEFYANESAVIVTAAQPTTQATIDAAVSAALVANPPVSLFMKAIMERRCFGVFNSPPLPNSSYAEPATMIVGPFPFGDFTGFTPYNVAVYDGAAWQEFNASAFARVPLSVIATEWPNLRTITYGGLTLDERIRPEGIGSLLGGEHVPFAGGPTFADLIAAGWVVEYPDVGGLTVNTNYYPPPQLNDGDTIRVGGAEAQVFYINTDLSLNVASKTDISGTNSQELAFGALWLEIQNSALVRCVVNFAGASRPVRALFEPFETRRFLIIRRSGGSGDLTISTLDNPSQPDSIPLESGWFHTGAPFDDSSQQRLGDVVTIRLAVTAQAGAGSALGVLSAEFRPQSQQVLPAVVWDGSAFVPGAVDIASTGAITLLAPITPPPAGGYVRCFQSFNRVRVSP